MVVCSQLWLFSTTLCSEFCTTSSKQGPFVTLGIGSVVCPMRGCGPAKVGNLEARVRIELTHKGFADLSLTTWVPRLQSECLCCRLSKIGAGNGIRTRDFDLGKVALYH
jgi:hypothetical protein